MSDVKVEFGNRLRKLREAKGLTQEVLGYNAGLDRTYISSVERGKRNISLESIECLAVALEIEIKEFFEN